MSNLQIATVSPAIGAIVRDIDLSAPLDASDVKKIGRALVDHKVLFFRDQTLTPEQHRDFAARFGPLHIHPFYPTVPSVPEIIVLSFGPDRRPDADVWHTDVTSEECPPLGCVLHAREVPPSGGDTLWCSMEALYESLSVAMQRFLETLSAEHFYLKAFDSTNVHGPDGVEKLERARREHPPVVHPLIRTHPISGRKCVFVNAAFTTRIIGLTPGESSALLSFLLAQVGRPEHTARWRWRLGDVAFWDNRSTQHYGVADYWPQPRHMERATIVGDRPV